MPQPDVREYIDNQASEVAQVYLQSPQNFVSTQVFPRVSVSKQDAKYYVFDKAQLNADDMQARANGEESAGSGFKLSQDSYHCEVYALHRDITARDRSNWNNPNISIEDSTTQWLMRQALQRLERQFVADFLSTSKWATDITLSGTTQWSDFANSDPLADVDLACTTVAQATGFTPNTGVIGFQAWQKLKRHPLIVDRVSGGATTQMPAQVLLQTVASLMEIDRLFIARAVKTTSKENASTTTTDFIFGKAMLVCYVSPNADMMSPSAGYTFTWDSVGNGQLGVETPIANIPVPTRGLGTQRLESEIGFDHKITGSDLGYFIASAVS
jgi:hypothetical protein